MDEDEINVFHEKKILSFIKMIIRQLNAKQMEV
jgi:hypothetical protein